jgi:hypothetical protein
VAASREFTFGPPPNEAIPAFSNWCANATFWGCSKSSRSATVLGTGPFDAHKVTADLLSFVCLSQNVHGRIRLGPNTPTTECLYLDNLAVLPLKNCLVNLIIPDKWQQDAVSLLRKGKDVVVHAPTGAGKTYSPLVAGAGFEPATSGL